MIFWIIWTAVVSLSIGFVMGATFRQYVPIGKYKDGGIIKRPENPGAQWGFMSDGCVGGMMTGDALHPYPGPKVVQTFINQGQPDRLSDKQRADEIIRRLARQAARQQ